MHSLKLQDSDQDRGELLVMEVDSSVTPPTVTTARSSSNQQSISSQEFISAAVAVAPLWKRILDVSCILLALPLLAPVALLVAVIIKLGSKGPLLFKQERVGFLGRRFTIYKFRTMRDGADTRVHKEHWDRLILSNSPMVKLDAKGDPRLIPGGWLLRATGLDELAQLLNVLLGDMSLVGPRPCLPSEYEKYFPWQLERFKAVPGLTGLWQVSGKNRTTFTEMMNLDIAYARKQSVWLDLKIMLKTVPAVVQQVRDTSNLKQSRLDQSPVLNRAA